MKKLEFPFCTKNKTSLSLSLQKQSALFSLSSNFLSSLLFSNIRRRAIQQQPQPGHVRLIVLLYHQEVQPARGDFGLLPRRGLLGRGRAGRDGAVPPALADARVEDEAAALRVGRERGDLVAGCPGCQREGAPRVDGDA